MTNMPNFFIAIICPNGLKPVYIHHCHNSSSASLLISWLCLHPFPFRFGYMYSLYPTFERLQDVEIMIESHSQYTNRRKTHNILPRSLVSIWTQIVDLWFYHLA